MSAVGAYGILELDMFALQILDSFINKSLSLSTCISLAAMTWLLLSTILTPHVFNFLCRLYHANSCIRDTLTHVAAAFCDFVKGHTPHLAYISTKTMPSMTSFFNSL
ncbi:hypothetical protein GOP47_0021153 [Adiantum capillus-veneris]|uniref:Uncharacterized protein n=1 Tax=Adiantum capillus-veneris TaxID=13818 RepID=A0A9D4UAK4_ADICA|nr:hypothetical protein GOP47_0021153 [Adiantum capillus-veneris]